MALFASFGLVACDKEKIDDETKMEQALNSIALGDLNSLTQPFDLISVTGKHKLPITWSLENVEGEQAELDLSGAVPRVIITQDPYRGVDENGKPLNKWGHAVLTATVRIKDKTKSRSWDLYIKPADEFYNLSVIEAAQQSEGTPVKVEGTVTYVHSNGFYIADETGSIYVYKFPSSATLKDKILPGAKVEIEGNITIYYGQPEIGEKYNIKIKEEAPATFNYAELAEETYLPEIVWREATDPKAYGRIVNFVGKVVEDNSGKTTYYQLFDETFNLKITIYDESSGAPKQFLDQVKEKVGKYVKATFVVYNYHSSYKIWRVFGVPGTVQEVSAFQYTQENKLELAAAKIRNSLDGSSVFSNITLPTSLSEFEGLTVTWASSHPDIISTTGVFNYPEETTEVELTMTLKLGTLEKQSKLKVTAVAPRTMTVAEVHKAIDMNQAKTVLVEGVIIGRDSDGYFYLADETGVIFVRTKLSDFNVAVGDKVKIIADGSFYDGKDRYGRRLADGGNAVITKVDNEKHESPLALTDASISDFDHTITKSTLKKFKEEELASQLLKISGYFRLIKEGSYTNTYLAESMDENAPKMKIYYKSYNVSELNILDGQQVTLIVAVYEVYPESGGWALGFMGREGDVILTDEVKEAVARKELDALMPENNNLTEDLDFPAETKYKLIIDNVTYQFISDTPSVLGNDGKFTAPEEDTEVTLTVKAIFSETHEKEFTYTLTAKADATPAEPKEELLLNLDFGTAPKNGYEAGNLTFTNGDGAEYTFNKNRVQTNTSKYAPHIEAGAFLVLSTNVGNKEAWIEFDWVSLNLTKITIDLSVWNNDQHFETIVNSQGARISLEKYVNDQWVAVKNTDNLENVLSKLVKGQYTTVSFENLTAGKYRLYYTDPQTTAPEDKNTITAITADNIKVYGYKNK